MELACTNLWSLLAAGRHNSAELARRQKSAELALLACTKSGECVCTPRKSNSYSNCATFAAISFAIILGCSGLCLLLILDFFGAIIAVHN